MNNHGESCEGGPDASPLISPISGRFFRKRHINPRRDICSQASDNGNISRLRKWKNRERMIDTGAKLW